MSVVAHRRSVELSLGCAKAVSTFASERCAHQSSMLRRARAVFACMLPLLLSFPIGNAQELESKNPVLAKYDSRVVAGWTVHVHEDLRRKMPKKTELAIDLLKKQLDVLITTLPKKPLTQLRTVTLWFSPQYEGFRQGAEYHPNAAWLLRNGRPEEFAKCVEFTNVKIFERECVRMPMLALHELAHAYHDPVLGI